MQGKGANGRATAPTVRTAPRTERAGQRGKGVVVHLNNRRRRSEPRSGDQSTEPRRLLATPAKVMAALTHTMRCPPQRTRAHHNSGAQPTHTRKKTPPKGRKGATHKLLVSQIGGAVMPIPQAVFHTFVINTACFMKFCLHQLPHDGIRWFFLFEQKTLKVFL